MLGPNVGLTSVYSASEAEGYIHLDSGTVHEES